MEQAKRRGPVQFRDVDVEAALDQRGETGGVTAARDLARYYHLLADELRAVNLTEAEALAVCDACNGTLWEPHTVRLLWAQVADALEDGLDAKWEIAATPLVMKLRALTPGQTFALVDAVERWWRLGGEDHLTTLRAVGLVR